MDQSGREDPKLSEVRAVLHRLQGLPAESKPGDFPAVGTNPRRGLWIGLTGIFIVTTAAIVVVLLAFSNWTEQATSVPKGAPKTTAPKTTAPKEISTKEISAKEASTAGSNTTSVAKAGSASQASIKAALDGAAALMNSGRIQAARRQLLAVATDGSPDVALALARTYDPNVLAQIPAPDAVPDVVEATRWYRAWHAAAVKQGMSLDRMSLERIIGSMQR
jgi:hypothetical protein